MAMVSILGGCGSDDAGRSAARLSEVETTRQAGSTTTVERIELEYKGSQLSEVNAYLNGAPNGTTRISYAGDSISRIDFADKQGDRAFSTLTYANGRLTRERYEVTGAFMRETNVVYDPSSGNVKEETYTRSTTGTTMPHTWLQRFEYDNLDRIEKIMLLDGSQTSTSEMRYDAEGRVERSSTYQGQTHEETYDFRYLANGALDEILDTHNGRVGLTYTNGLITEIRYSSGSTTETNRYTYEDGSVAGATFAPAIPLGELFDLAGKSYSELSLTHFAPPTAGDIVHVESNTGGGGGDGSGSGDTCPGFDSNGSACENCGEAACCTEIVACQPGTACDDYYNCAYACNGASACLSSCQSQYPSGASAFQTFSSCIQGSCGSVCQ